MPIIRNLNDFAFDFSFEHSSFHQTSFDNYKDYPRKLLCIENAGDSQLLNKIKNLQQPIPIETATHEEQSKHSPSDIEGKSTESSNKKILDFNIFTSGRRKSSSSSESLEIQEQDSKQKSLKDSTTLIEAKSTLEATSASSTPKSNVTVIPKTSIESTTPLRTTTTSQTRDTLSGVSSTEAPNQLPLSSPKDLQGPSKDDQKTAQSAFKRGIPLKDPLTPSTTPPKSLDTTSTITQSKSSIDPKKKNLFLKTPDVSPITKSLTSTSLPTSEPKTPITPNTPKIPAEQPQTSTPKSFLQSIPPQPTASKPQDQQSDMPSTETSSKQPSSSQNVTGSSKDDSKTTQSPFKRGIPLKDPLTPSSMSPNTLDPILNVSQKTSSIEPEKTNRLSKTPDVLPINKSLKSEALSSTKPETPAASTQASTPKSFIQSKPAASEPRYQQSVTPSADVINKSFKDSETSLSTASEIDPTRDSSTKKSLKVPVRPKLLIKTPDTQVVKESWTSEETSTTTSKLPTTPAEQSRAPTQTTTSSSPFKRGIPLKDSNISLKYYSEDKNVNEPPITTTPSQSTTEPQKKPAEVLPSSTQTAKPTPTSTVSSSRSSITTATQTSASISTSTVSSSSSIQQSSIITETPTSAPISTSTVSSSRSIRRLSISKITITSTPISTDPSSTSIQQSSITTETVAPTSTVSSSRSSITKPTSAPTPISTVPSSRSNQQSSITTPTSAQTPTVPSSRSNQQSSITTATSAPTSTVSSARSNQQSSITSATATQTPTEPSSRPPSIIPLPAPPKAKPSVPDLTQNLPQSTPSVQPTTHKPKIPTVPSFTSPVTIPAAPPPIETQQSTISTAVSSFTEPVLIYDTVRPSASTVPSQSSVTEVAVAAAAAAAAPEPTVISKEEEDKFKADIRRLKEQLASKIESRITRREEDLNNKLDNYLKVVDEARFQYSAACRHWLRLLNDNSDNDAQELKNILEGLETINTNQDLEKFIQRTLTMNENTDNRRSDGPFGNYRKRALLYRALNDCVERKRAVFRASYPFINENVDIIINKRLSGALSGDLVFEFVDVESCLQTIMKTFDARRAVARTREKILFVALIDNGILVVNDQNEMKILDETLNTVVGPVKVDDIIDLSTNYYEYIYVITKDKKNSETKIIMYSLKLELIKKIDCWIADDHENHAYALCYMKINDSVYVATRERKLSRFDARLEFISNMEFNYDVLEMKASKDKELIYVITKPNENNEYHLLFIDVIKDIFLRSTKCKHFIGPPKLHSISNKYFGFSFTCSDQKYRFAIVDDKVHQHSIFDKKPFDKFVILGDKFMLVLGDYGMILLKLTLYGQNIYRRRK